jgi:hypothetical protein
MQTPPQAHLPPSLASRLMRDGGEIGQAAFQTALPRIIDRLKADVTARLRKSL